MKIVLDTNVIVSMALGGTLGILADEWDRGSFQVVISEPIAAEYAAVLLRPKFNLPRDVVDAVLVYIHRKAEYITPEETITAISSDPTDNRFLECAISGHVEYLVSGDPHLLELKQYRGIPILTPREFLLRLPPTKQS
jgi:uncharacterized protein